MKSIKVCEYSRSGSFYYDLILQDQASGERSQDQWSSGFIMPIIIDIMTLHCASRHGHLSGRPEVMHTTCRLPFS